MRRFIVMTFVFGSFVVLLGMLSGLMADEGLRQLKTGEYGEWNHYRSANIQSNMIIMGNSRAYRHFSPKILDSILHVDCYNLGATNATFPFQRLRYTYYSRFAPKPLAIILSVDAGTTLDIEDGIPDKQQYIPYLNEPGMRKGLTGYSNSFSWFDYYNPITKYNRSFEAMRKGLFSFWGLPEKTEYKYKGFMNENYTWDGTYEQFKAQYPYGTNITVNPAVVEDLASFISQVSNEGIKLVMVYSPEYIDGQQMITNRDSIVQIYKRMAYHAHVPFLDYSSDSICFKKSFFYNTTHLTLLGAESFSKRLAVDLDALGFSLKSLKY